MAQRDALEVVYSCAACQSEAAKIVLFVSTELPQAYAGQALKRSFATLISADVCGKVSISVPRASYNTTAATLMRAVSGTDAMAGAKYTRSFCPTCQLCYCEEHWRIAEHVESGGWYDKTIGTCPKGHRHILDD
ncbi:hypothetical protein [Roseobacter litoralis]|uniref:Uncharacterized protein n=1 Tax=Roseobacter litoralis (strain ATCC 49566 / DSM 6996 / JCM 21268 / NBRC 15278 / OCh 149) TaxID=391595 RepID=F7ZJP2_ROSLO|nr:hypothetical protein [Roseobacter litoralis]AEI93873.1 hypothetical protein RLO149_c018850 [Roseobacter litoralis Och 149]